MQAVSLKFEGKVPSIRDLFDISFNKVFCSGLAVHYETLIPKLEGHGTVRTPGVPLVLSSAPNTITVAMDSRPVQMLPET